MTTHMKSLHHLRSYYYESCEPVYFLIRAIFFLSNICSSMSENSSSSTWSINLTIRHSSCRGSSYCILSWPWLSASTTFALYRAVGSLATSSHASVHHLFHTVWSWANKERKESNALVLRSPPEWDCTELDLSVHLFVSPGPVRGSLPLCLL